MRGVYDYSGIWYWVPGVMQMHRDRYGFEGGGNIVALTAPSEDSSPCSAAKEEQRNIESRRARVVESMHLPNAPVIAMFKVP